MTADVYQLDDARAARQVRDLARLVVAVALLLALAWAGRGE